MQCRYLWLMLIAILGVTSGCHDDPEQTKLTYMPDMMNAPTVKPQRGYLDPPDHSVSRESMIYPKTQADAETALTNPLAESGGSDFHLAMGKELYGIYCSVCHGDSGKGDGHITDKFPKAPDLTSDTYKGKKDGFFFHTITFGSPSKMMPSYGHATGILERWQIVNYVRVLQRN